MSSIDDCHGRLQILIGLQKKIPKTVLAATGDVVGASGRAAMAVMAGMIRMRRGHNPAFRDNRCARTIRRESVHTLHGPGQQDPGVLAEALDLSLGAEPADPEWLVGLLSHADARVRENATWAIAELDDLCADERVLSKLIEILERDDDAPARLAAAAALFGIYDDDPASHLQVADAIVRLRRDPLPDLRAKAILVQAAADTDHALVQLLDELAVPEPPWQMVHACALLNDWPSASPSLRIKANVRITQLQQQGWTQRGVPGR